MPVRIYSLAKELAIDSKELVDICNRIGITGKGSALASLEDDEIARIKKHIAASAAPSAPAAKAAPERAPVVQNEPMKPIGPVRGTAASVGKPPIIQARGKKAATPAVEEVVPVVEEVVAPPPEEVSVPEEVLVEEPVAEVVEPEVVEPEVEEPEVKPSTPEVTREAYVRPMGSMGGKVRVIGSRARATEAKPADEKRKAKTREPVINIGFAKIPKSGMQAPPAPKKDEPAPQKPEIKLTRDLIVGSRQGDKTQLDQFVQAENQKSKAALAAAAPGGLSKFKADADKAKAKGKKGDEIDEEEEVKGKRGLSGLAASRADRSTKRRVKLRPDDINTEEDEVGRGSKQFKQRRGGSTAAPRKEKVALELPCTVRSFSEAAGVPAARVLRSLMGMGLQTLNINAALDEEQAMILATELGVDLEFKSPETLENSLLRTIDNLEDSEEDLAVRPPIVTFLGHVDHGKTSLLDYLIGTKIVLGEAGGITQHIRAYQVEKDGRFVSFVDTPGHEAFTEMRARGANVTDIAVLVIAADDGIMPQTEEAISHAKAANVPIVVALNKIDLPGADANRVMTQMTEHGLTPSEWGGDVEVVRTSAITGQGMDELLDTLLTVAELHEFRANPNRAAVGVCLESEQESNRGVIAKVMVRNGTLRVGDIVVCGSAHGRVKALYDTLLSNKQLTQAGPSVPVNITGLDRPPEAGEQFYVLDDIAQAREIAVSREAALRKQVLSGTSPKVSFETFQELLQSGRLGQKEERVILNLIVRADARGSLEAIEKELTKLEHPEVDIRVLQKSVGGISVADVTLASASQAVIVGFNVIPDEAARMLAEERNVEIRRYDIIYNLTNDIKAIVEGRLKPEEKVVELGRALVKQVFSISRVGTIAGCYVAQGAIERGCRIRVNRDGRTIGDYALDTLRRHKDDVKEVPRGMECGIRLAGFNDIKQDDILEAYKIEEVARTLDGSK